MNTLIKKIQASIEKSTGQVLSKKMVIMMIAFVPLTIIFLVLFYAAPRSEVVNSAEQEKLDAEVDMSL